MRIEMKAVFLTQDWLTFVIDFVLLLLLLGDFNMDMYENRDESRFPDTRLVDFCNRFCLSNRIDNPTRVTKTFKSLIDVLLTSHAECYATSGSLHLGLSDHDLIFTVRNK